jgi:[acyl-carrier-protein] S-malonyltransferase
MSDQGVNKVFEIGSGKVLTGLARRIDRDLAGTAIGKPDDIGPALETLA